MTTLNLLTASLDDIVFEGRNKAYGAFVLRQLYHRHLQRAVGIATALFLLLVATPLLVQYFGPAPVVVPDFVPNLPVVELQTVQLPKDKPAVASRPATAPPVVRPPELIVPTVVKTLTQVKPEPLPSPTLPVADFTDDVMPGNAVRPGTGTGTSAGSDSGKTTVVSVAPPKPFLTAEIMPAFAGGDKALGEYFRRNLHYPSLALRNQVSGRVYVSFTVGTTGEVMDVEVLKGLGYGTEEEAKRVIKSMPHWVPGQQGGRAVPVRFTLPITFQFQ